MQLSKNGLLIIESFEGLKLTAYQDQAGIWTIGYGSILYQSGMAVKEFDTITQQQAEDLLLWEINLKTASVNAMIQKTLNQNQFDSLISFAFNEGVGALHSSTLLRLVNQNPEDQNITAAFLMWDKIHKNGMLQFDQGIYNRRETEAKLYFSPVLAA